MKLRPYQQAAVDAVWAYLQRGGRAPLVEIPTGGGKSPVLGELVRRSCASGARVLVATHRKELITQDAKAIASMWPGGDIGIYSAGLGSKEVRQCTVGGVQSLYRQTDKLGRVDVVIIDEAHLVSTRGGTQYTRLLEGLREHNDDLVLIGLTATPYRMGQGMLTHGEGALFRSIVYRAGIRQLVDEGYLSPIVSARPKVQINTSGLRIRAGEYVSDEMEKAADTEEITSAVVADIIESGRKHILVFGVTVAHAARMRNALRMAGVSTEMVVGDTPNRDDILASFKRGELSCITSCDVLTTGFDAPLVDCVVLVRATNSVSLYVQMVGRGSRLAEGKRDCLLLDYGGNLARHGPLDEIIEFTDEQEIVGGGDAPKKDCPECRAMIPAGCRNCPECGHEFPAPRMTGFNPQASSGEVIGDRRKTANKITHHEIDEVTYDAHTSKTSGMPMLKVSYFGPASKTRWHPVATEYVCLFHDETNPAHKKAAEWWFDRCPRIPRPKTADEAAEMARDYARPVAAIKVAPNQKNPRFPRITSVEYAPIREPGDDDVGNDEPAPTDIFGGEELPF